MTTPLLAAKLYTPPLRSELVSRPRLIRRLNAGLDRKLTLISAPAGFGKTTLVSEWIHSRREGSYGASPIQAAWLSLDDGDNDLGRFLTYLIGALQTIKADTGQGVLAALQSLSPVNPEPILTSLLNEVAAFPDHLVLVLDDYHVIESQAIDRTLTFILDHLTPQMHLVIASRIEPTLPLSRLRARGQLTELRQADLRFTTEEAIAFLGQVIPFPISIEDVRTLEERTEGWITGLQLAAVAMQSLGQRDQIAGFMQSFSGSHRYVIDYLVDEVLDQQTPRVQEFLLQTSILHRMVAPLCDAVVGREDSQKTLEGLEAANLFLVPLDDERRWYRYHHLFGDLLKRRLSQAFPEQILELHQRAGTWYQESGDIDEAVHHVLAAGDIEQAAGILEDHWQVFFVRGELTKL